jgi:hypothetical protein
MAQKVRKILEVTHSSYLFGGVSLTYFILKPPHSAQQLMSGEATPLLSGMLPAFQSLQNKWEQYITSKSDQDLAPCVLEGMSWLNKYHEKAGRTPAYVIAMGTSYSLPIPHCV